MKRIRIYIILLVTFFLSYVFIINEYVKTKSELNILKYKSINIEISLDKKIKYYENILDSLPFGHPLDTLIIVSAYGWRLDPMTNKKSFHYGVDLSCNVGEPILSTAHGKVIEASYFSNYGNCVIISHSLGYMTLYAHLSKVLVNKDDLISKGDTIGLGGNTGKSTGAHLHYEVINKNLNPENYLNYY